MKKFALIVFLTLTFAVIFSACSSSTDSTDTTNYYPMKSGNFWVYATSTKMDGTTTNSVDSTVTKEQSTQFGQLCFRFENYSDGIKGNDTYQYSANNKLYTSIKSVLPSPDLLPLPSNLVPDAWVVIADNNSSSWDIFTLPVDSIPITYGGLTFSLSGTIKIQGKKSEKTTVNFMDKNYTAQKFIMEVNINGTIGGTIPVNFTIKTNYYYVENIGLVKSETLSTTITILIQTITTPEINSTLTNYFVVENL
jgi:hypothetical protein